MKKYSFLVLIGVSYGYFYSSYSVAPTINVNHHSKNAGRSISSIPVAPLMAIDIKNELSQNEVKIVEALNESQLEKLLASLFIMHSKSDKIGNSDYFHLTKNLTEELKREPKQSMSSLKKAFKLSELKNEFYERSTLIVIGRSLPEEQKKELALMSEEYLEKEFLGSSLNVSDLSEVDASSLSLPVVAFEEVFRLKSKNSKDQAKKWSKTFSEKCKNKVLKQSFLDKENALLSEAV